MNAPVIMFGFNRPELQSMVMERFVDCVGARDRDIFVYLDGPRNAEDRAKSDEIFQMLSGYQVSCLPRMKIFRREYNFGCRENICQGITEILKRYGRAIMIEDDILVSRTFLEFMDNALEFYKDDQRIWSINGFQKFLLRIPSDYPYDVYYAYIMSAWGWATWNDRWCQVDFDMKDWPDFRSRPENIDLLNKAGLMLVPMLDRQYEGKLKTWDVQCMFHMMKNGLYSIEPRYQVSKNIGCLPNSEHFHFVDPYMLAQKFYNFLPRLSADLILDERIMRQHLHCSFNPNLLVRLWRKMHRQFVKTFCSPCYIPVEVPKVH